MLKFNLIGATSSSLNKILNTIQKLLGIKNNTIINAGWIFISGIPIGFMLFGNSFVIPVWFTIVGVTLIISNLKIIS